MNRYRCKTCNYFRVNVKKCPLWNEKHNGDERTEYGYWLDKRDELLPIVGCASHSSIQNERDKVLIKAREAIFHDHTGLAEIINKMLKLVEKYEWIERGEWGSYQYDERNVETLTKEICWCFEELRELGKTGLKQSGNRATEWILKIEKEIAELHQSKQEGGDE